MIPGFKGLPIDVATLPPANGAFMVYKDRYWLTYEDQLLFFSLYKDHAAPQCNSDERIMLMSKNPEGTEIRFFKRVYVPINAYDFDYKV